MSDGGHTTRIGRLSGLRVRVRRPRELRGCACLLAFVAACSDSWSEPVASAPSADAAAGSPCADGSAGSSCADATADVPAWDAGGTDGSQDAADGDAVEAAADGTDEPATGCLPSQVDGLAVAQSDFYGGMPFQYGYPPYAIDGCTLVYVAPPQPPQAQGELRMREIDSGKETVLAPASEQPRRPTVAGGVVAWEATVGGVSAIRARHAGATVTVAGSWHHATEPRAAHDAVVFTAWMGPAPSDDTDVVLFLPGSSAQVVVAGGPKQQRFADVSPTHVAVSDFTEDAEGWFDPTGEDLADIVVIDRATLVPTARPLEGKQLFPLLADGGRLGYLDWRAKPVPPEPKLEAFALYVGDIAAAPETDVLVADIRLIGGPAPTIRPTARGALFDWVTESLQGQRLLRRPVDLSSTEVELGAFASFGARGPAASSAMTIVAVQQGGGLRLKGYAR